jgi:hypothetical protein
VARSVFVSYSHRDREWLDKLIPYLKPLERDGLIRVFKDTDIEVGDRWREDIERGLAEADAAILLVSETFLASDFITGVELPRLLEAAEQRGVSVLPVIVRPVAWADTPLSAFQALNPPERSFLELSEAEQARYFLKLQRKVIGTAASTLRPAPVVEPSANGNSAAVEEIVKWLLSHRLSIYLGSWTAIGDKQTPPTPGEMMEELASPWGQPQASQIVVPVDVLGSYYTIRRSQLELDDLVQSLVLGRSEKVPPLFTSLARLARITQERDPPRTNVRAKRQLVLITTNLDVLLENALLMEGVSFFRIVQVRGAARIEVEYFERRPGGAPRPDEVPRTDVSAFGRSIGVDEMGRLIADATDPLRVTDATAARGSERKVNPLLLLKLHGSADVEESCSVSCDHHYALVRNLPAMLPELVSGALSSNHDLFLGYSLLDSDLRTIHHGLPRKKKPDDPYRGFFVHARPGEHERDAFRRWERTLWDRLERVARGLDLELVDLDEETLLATLIASVEADG